MPTQMPSSSKGVIHPERGDWFESPGLSLEVRLPERGEISLKLSEKVVLQLAHWLIMPLASMMLALLFPGVSAKFWPDRTPAQTTQVPPTAEIQPRK